MVLLGAWWGHRCDTRGLAQPTLACQLLPVPILTPSAIRPAVLFFLLLLLAAALLMMYLHHHRYKGSYHTNEPKATQDYNRGGGGEGEGRSAEPVATPAAKPVAPRKDPNLPQILEESKTE